TCSNGALLVATVAGGVLTPDVLALAVVVGLAVEALVLAAGALAAVTGGVALFAGVFAVALAGVLAVTFFALSEDAACVDTRLPSSRDAGVPARAGVPAAADSHRAASTVVGTRRAMVLRLVVPIARGSLRS